MEEPDEVHAEVVHHIYEQQVADVDARMLDELWERIATAAAAAGNGGGAARVERAARALTLTDVATGRTLRFAADEVLDLPKSERPGPFQMGNARVTVTAWDGTRRAWLLRSLEVGASEYVWVTVPGDVPVDDSMLGALMGGLRRGEMPADPAETAHLDTASPQSDATSLAAGARWAIVNLYSGQARRPDEVFASGADAGEALKALVRRGELREGDWEVRPVAR